MMKKKKQKIRERKTYLLSFPRSGNTWVRYCIAHIINPIVAGSRQKTVDLSGSDKVLLKVHHINNDRAQKTKKSHKLILLVRNPYEAIVRTMNKKNIGLTKRRSRKYFNCLEMYNDWEADKILIYYEDLILNPKKTLKKILKFLNISSRNLDDFISSYEFHQKRSLKYYHKVAERGRTEGDANKLNYHSKLTHKDNLSEVKRLVNCEYKDLSIKYLKRYMNSV